MRVPTGCLISRSSGHVCRYYQKAAQDEAGPSIAHDAAHSNFYDAVNKSGMALKPG